METNTTLVWPNGSVILYPVTNVDVDITLIIHPGHLEGENTVRLNQPLKNTCLCKSRVLIVHILDRFKDLLDCLMILGFAGMLLLKVSQNLFYFHFIVFYGL
ncbi:MAG: hypothetical protein BWY89_01544 [Bacteroidetes bacterium ADurb.BinA012]|nr:MAG: hypothetical protein BWY89_01544 [Bacteroidetes bacterium ADurb.BinA012]